MNTLGSMPGNTSFSANIETKQSDAPVDNVNPNTASAIELVDDTRFGVLINGIGLLLKKNIFSEMVDLPNYGIVPKTSPWLLGISNLRGTIYPIFDFHLLFGFKRHNTNQRPKVLIIHGNKSMVGFLIEKPPLLMKNIQAATNKKTPSNFPENLVHAISGIYTSDNQDWFEFDHDVFFHNLSKQIQT